MKLLNKLNQAKILKIKNVAVVLLLIIIEDKVEVECQHGTYVYRVHQYQCSHRYTIQMKADSTKLERCKSTIFLFHEAGDK